MKKRVFIQCLFSLGCSLLLSCSSGSAIKTGDDDYPPTKADNVKVFLNAESVKRPYKEIGMVTAQKTAGWTFTNVSDEAVIKILRKKAATIGADAIIMALLEGDSKPWAVVGAGGSSSLDRKTAKAIAIKFTKE